MKKPSLTGSDLKRIAVVTMLIDHVGSALIGPIRSALPESYTVLAEFLRQLYPVMRGVGRLAFPIFCFLLVEGFLHTRNAVSYAKRLFLFALISEIPFDFALARNLFSWRHQNVYFTLLIGLLVMMGISYLEKKTPRSEAERLLNGLCQILIAAGGLYLAKYMYTDYGFKGVFLIEVLYALRHDRKIQAIFGAVAISWETYGPLGFIPVWFYNGERGKQNKAFFYWFYPVHLLLIGIFKYLLLSCAA